MFLPCNFSSPTKHFGIFGGFRQKHFGKMEIYIQVATNAVGVIILI